MGLIPSVPLRQFNREELLDVHNSSHAEVEKSLRDIARINCYLNGARPICEATFELLRRQNKTQATVLDIGTGNADIPRRLIAQSAKQGVELKVFGLDINTLHLQIAQKATQNALGINLVQANGFQLPFADQSIDVIIASLFLHHFRPEQIQTLLKEFSRVARVGWLMNDLIRDAVPLWFFRLTRPIFAHSYLTRHDGEASIRRAYTLTEMQTIVAPIAGAQTREVFPYRLMVSWERDSAGV